MLLIPRTSLRVDPGRQRGTIAPEAIAALADSIEANTLFHPPVAQLLPDGAYSLLAGETRLRAIDFLHSEGKTIRCGGTDFPPGTVPITPLSELSEIEAFTIELEENIRRTPLPWQREVEATARLHKLKLAAGLSRREALRSTGEAMATLQSLASPKAPAEVHQALLLAQHSADPDIAKARTLTDAVKILARKLQKADDAAAPAPAFDHTSFLNEDCLAVLARLPDAQFDAIISDPPYGIDIRVGFWQASEHKYDDSYESWRALMDGLWEELPRILKPNATGFLFCDWSRFEELVTRATRAGFETYPRPLIWNRAPDGRLTTPEKWPRRCYETILYFRRGTRALREFRPDVLSYLIAERGSSTNYHGARKPDALFRDLAERVVGPGDYVLDPFAGSGPLSRAARALNLRHLSIEQDPAYYGLMLRLYDPKESTNDPL